VFSYNKYYEYYYYYYDDWMNFSSKSTTRRQPECRFSERLLYSNDISKFVLIFDSDRKKQNMSDECVVVIKWSKLKTASANNRQWDKALHTCFSKSI
jgi:hypothetical protein